MTSILLELQANDVGYATIDRSHLDARVWVPHIPFSDIASSEGCATTSIRRAKAHVQKMYGWAIKPTWVKVADDMWVLYDATDLE